MKKLCHRHGAFTLVEVVLSLGLIGFALLAVLAFFPTGMASNRSSMEDTRAAQLVRAITGTIDSQSSTFSNVNCYGMALDLTSLSTMTEATSSHILYASYTPASLPVITTASGTDSIYSIEMRFENNPVVAPAAPPNPAVTLGAGKINLIQFRVYSKAKAEGPVELFYLARNKG